MVISTRHVGAVVSEDCCHLALGDTGHVPICGLDVAVAHCWCVAHIIRSAHHRMRR